MYTTSYIHVLYMCMLLFHKKFTNCTSPQILQPKDCLVCVLTCACRPPLSLSYTRFTFPPLQPSWTVYIQVMTFTQAETFRWNPFDLTKV